MRSTLCSLISSRGTVGRSLFASLAVAGAVLALLVSGGLAEQSEFVAGPLDDTWEYLLELWRMMFG